MGRLTNSKKIKLLRIEKARLELSVNLKNGFIKEEDIILLSDKNINYGFGNSKAKTSYKQYVLRSIFNCPFILCDQDSLSLNIKRILPFFLASRYKTEKEELEYQYEEGYISKEKYEKELDELEFVYYKSSNDGKSILKTGHGVDVKDNIIKIIYYLFFLKYML